MVNIERETMAGEEGIVRSILVKKDRRWKKIVSHQIIKRVNS